MNNEAPLRIAIADPPYPGCCGLYGHHHEAPYGCWDHPATTVRLIRNLHRGKYDGWALHTAATTLPVVLDALTRLEVKDYRVMVWVKPSRRRDDDEVAEIASALAAADAVGESPWALADANAEYVEDRLGVAEQLAAALRGLLAALDSNAPGGHPFTWEAYKAAYENVRAALAARDASRGVTDG